MICIIFWGANCAVSLTIPASLISFEANHPCYMKEAEEKRKYYQQSIHSRRSLDYNIVGMGLV